MVLEINIREKKSFRFSIEILQLQFVSTEMMRQSEEDDDSGRFQTLDPVVEEAGARRAFGIEGARARLP